MDPGTAHLPTLLQVKAFTISILFQINEQELITRTEERDPVNHGNQKSWHVSDILEDPQNLKRRSDIGANQTFFPVLPEDFSHHSRPVDTSEGDNTIRPVREVNEEVYFRGPRRLYAPSRCK